MKNKASIDKDVLRLSLDETLTENANKFFVNRTIYTRMLVSHYDITTEEAEKTAKKIIDEAEKECESELTPGSELGEVVDASMVLLDAMLAAEGSRNE